MRKAFLVVAVTLVALLCAGRAQMAYAVDLTTYSCQGHDTVPVEPGITISDAALWSVTTLNSKFTSGTLFATYQFDIDETDTCVFGLNTTQSGFESFDGFTIQYLDWISEEGPCDSFQDTVFLITSGTAGVMNDDNLDDDQSPGSGTCLVK
jgi:hypothetical protein